MKWNKFIRVLFCSSCWRSKTRSAITVLHGRPKRRSSWKMWLGLHLRVIMRPSRHHDRLNQLYLQPRTLLLQRPQLHLLLIHQSLLPSHSSRIHSGMVLTLHTRIRTNRKGCQCHFNSRQHLIHSRRCQAFTIPIRHMLRWCLHNTSNRVKTLLTKHDLGFLSICISLDYPYPVQPTMQHYPPPYGQPQQQQPPQ